MTDAGYVGIGTTTPNYSLTVNGDINIVSTTATNTLRLNGIDFGQYFIDSAGTNGYVWTSDGSGAGGWSPSTGGETWDYCIHPTEGICDYTSVGAASTTPTGSKIHVYPGTYTETMNVSFPNSSNWYFDNAVLSMGANRILDTSSSNVILDGHITVSSSANNKVTLNTTNLQAHDLRWTIQMNDLAAGTTVGALLDGDQNEFGRFYFPSFSGWNKSTFGFYLVRFGLSTSTNSNLEIKSDTITLTDANGARALDIRPAALGFYIVAEIEGFTETAAGVAEGIFENTGAVGTVVGYSINGEDNIAAVATVNNTAVYAP
jgi:hypothetical protein